MTPLQSASPLIRWLTEDATTGRTRSDSYRYDPATEWNGQVPLFTLRVFSSLDFPILLQKDNLCRVFKDCRVDTHEQFVFMRYCQTL